MAEGGKMGAGVLAIVAGILLIAGQFTGAARWASLRDTFAGLVEITPPVEMLFFVIIGIASLGGVAAIVAGILLLRGQSALPRLLILLGVGFGTLGFLLYIVPQALGGRFPLIGESITVTAGIVLALVARSLGKR